MRIPRSRGAVSGLLLIVLGAWGALVPFVGPYFGLAFGTDDTWDWSSDRLWLSVVPGVVAVIGGLILMQSAHRGGAGFGAWLGVAAGAWFAVGPTVSRLWTDDGSAATGVPLGSTSRQVLEQLTFFEGLGVLMAAVAAFALGRLAVRSVRDVELAEAETRAAERPVATPASRDEDRFRREPRPVGAAAPAARRPWAGDDDDADAEAPTTRQPSRTATSDAPTTRQPAAVSSDRAVEPSPTTTAGSPIATTRDDDATRPIPPATPPASAGTRRSGGLMGRLRGR